MNKEFLEVKNVTYKVGFKTILSNISFSLGKGQILTIIGPSGSGKTSILKAIAGLIKPNIGNISFLKNILTSAEIFVPTGKRKIGLMFQEDVLFPHYTVYENIEFGILNPNVKLELGNNDLLFSEIGMIIVNGPGQYLEAIYL